jgi:hypothetical protein
VKNLLPIFALLLLVGCTSELDRCVEANFEQKAFMLEKDKKFVRDMCQISYTNYNKSVTSYEECVEEQLGVFDRMLKSWATEDAKKICNSQGIY